MAGEASDPADGGRRSRGVRLASTIATPPLVYPLILRIVRDRSDAADVLQDVFWEAWQGASSLRPRPRHARGVDDHARPDPGHRPRARRAPAQRDVRGRRWTRSWRPAPGESPAATRPSARRIADVMQGALSQLPAAAARGHRARILCGADADRDRRAPPAAARHGQDPDPARARAAPRRGEARHMKPRDRSTTSPPSTRSARSTATISSQFEAHLAERLRPVRGRRCATRARRWRGWRWPNRARAARRGEGGAAARVANGTARAPAPSGASWVPWAAATAAAMVVARHADRRVRRLPLRGAARRRWRARRQPDPRARLRRRDDHAAAQIAVYRHARRAPARSRHAGGRAARRRPEPRGHRTRRSGTSTPAASCGRQPAAGCRPARPTRLWTLGGPAPRPAGVFTVDASGQGRRKLEPTGDAPAKASPSRSSRRPASPSRPARSCWPRASAASSLSRTQTPDIHAPFQAWH